MSAKSITCPRCKAKPGEECKGGGMCVARTEAYNGDQDPALGKRQEGAADKDSIEGPGVGRC